MATPTAVPIRGVLNTNPSFDELVLINLSSDAEVEFGLDIESDTTLMTREALSVDSHVCEAKVRAVQ